MNIIVEAVDSEGQEWKLCAPDCHPAIFAKGKFFVDNASANERADVVMNAALESGLDPSERGGWEQLWNGLHGGGGNLGERQLAAGLGLTFVFSGQKLVYLPCARVDLGELGSGDSR
jgi:hypothetical protein